MTPANGIELLVGSIIGVYLIIGIHVFDTYEKITHKKYLAILRGIFWLPIFIFHGITSLNLLYERSELAKLYQMCVKKLFYGEN